MKEKRVVQNILVVVIVIAILGALLYSFWKKRIINTESFRNFLPTSSVENNSTPTPKITPNEQQERLITQKALKTDWVTYVNRKYDYQIDVPSGSSVIEEDQYNYTRIQNYAFRDKPGLANSEYYLEVYSSEDATVNNLNSCKSSLENQIAVTSGDAHGYKGIVKPQGGESAAIMYVLCIQKGNLLLNINASENSLLYSKQIIDTFRFIN